jgi:phosphoribosylamine--glycine ligase
VTGTADTTGGGGPEVSDGFAARKRRHEEDRLNVLILGSGGREHAIAHALARSSLVDTLFWTPGNAATRDLAENPRIPLDNFDSLIAFARKEHIELTVVGPEVPLVEGIADAFSEEGLDIFGPSAEGARIEGSKAYAKKLMEEKSVPTASFREYSNRTDALRALRGEEPPFVIKADGLAAGKGVCIVHSEDEAERVLTDIFEKGVFGESGRTVVIEEYLQGEEATVLALCDGKNVVPLISSQDHKPIHDGDKGPNTGGMGAIAPAPVVSASVMGRVVDTVLLPLVEAMSERGIDYRGVIYVGLMIREERPFVVEFNCRFGDPEAEAVLPLMRSDLCETLLRTVHGELDNHTIAWHRGYACDVVLVSGGYPGHYEKGHIITGLESLRDIENLTVYHAGTKESGGDVQTSGGRVLNIVGTGQTLEEAIDVAYSHVEKVFFDGMFYRTDIGFRGMQHFKRKSG